MINNMEWLNLNSQRNYPIKENAHRNDTTNTFLFPVQLIVDAVISSTIDNNFYIKTLKLYEQIIILGIYDKEDYYVGSVTINSSTHTEYDHYVINGQGKYINLQGKIVIGAINEISLAAIGSYEFAFAATELEEKAVVPSIKCVNSIAAGSADVIVGDVTLSAGYNARLRLEGNTIYIDAIDGEGLGPVCDCEDGLDKPAPIERINGIRPDDSGNFNLRGISCIKVNGAGGGVQIVNECEEPCCDCDDIAALEALLDAKQATIESLTARVVVLEGP